MIEMVEYELGDVLLLPKDKAVGIYTWVKEKFGKKVADTLAALEHHNYIHAELYVGGGYVLAAWTNGVHLISYPLSVFKNFNVYRHPKLLNKTEEAEHIRECLAANVRKYFNKPYDFVSLLLNALPEILSFGFEPLERMVESKLPYDNPEAMICSELVARMYEQCGIIIEPKAEFVTPDDLAEHFIQIA